MERFTDQSIDTLSQAANFEGLGSAWLDQFGEAWVDQSEPGPNDRHYLAAPATIGKREFDAILPELQQELHRHGRFGFVDSVSSTIRQSSTWRMPIALVIALAVQHGLARDNVVEIPKRP